MPNRANSTGAASGQGVPGDDLARTLWATLELSHPPVALAFVTQPDGGSHWSLEQRGTANFGRPPCAAIPTAMR
jgi:hypothetical protein